jgi:hypothetical protein
MPLLRSSFRLRALNKAVICAVAGALALPVNFSAHAANHPLTAVVNVNIIDYVVNVDWDFDNPPTQVNNPTQLLDRAYITSVIREAALGVFIMTEGRHRLGNIYVYSNKRFGNNVSIRLINTDGRSSADVAGFNVRNSTSFNHLSFEKTFESPRKLGRVIAHELGHYTYGLLDEYVEAGTPLNPNDPGAPSQSDNAKNTLMNDQNQFPSLSTPADYADPTRRQTAQARVFSIAPDLSGGSAWETLTRTPDQDPARARADRRTFFEAFRGINPATLELRRSDVGFDASLNMVFAPNPMFRDVIVVDRTLAADRFAELIQAAKAMVGQAKADTQFAIVASPAAANAALPSSVVRGYTDSTPEGKQALSAALDNLQSVPTGSAGTFDSLSAFTRAYQLLADVRKPGDLSSLHLLTGIEARLPVEAATSARLARVSVHPLGLMGSDANAGATRSTQARTQSAASKSVSLADAAGMTGGSYNQAKTGAEAAKDTVRALNETHAEPFASLSADASPALGVRGIFNSSFRVAGSAIDGEVVASLFFDPRDADKLKFSLIAPSGTVYTASNAGAGIELITEPAYGETYFVIAPDAPARAGQWTVRTEASAQTVDGIGLEVSSDSLTALSGSIKGGTLSDPTAITLRAKLGAEKSIKGAVVTADIYDSEGRLVLANVALRDDGVLPDTRAGDGQYAASLVGLLPAGEYAAVLKGVTNADSRIAELGALRQGMRDAATPVEVIGRISEFGFTLEAGAPGVMSATPSVVTPGMPGTTGTPGTGSTTGSAGTPAAVTSSSGGGCSVNPTGNDAGLALLLLTALAGGAMRRRQSRRNAGVAQAQRALPASGPAAT